MTVIIDYGVGNLFSLTSSFEAIGAEVTVSSSPEVIRAADRLILPGVGAFEDAAKKLREEDGRSLPILVFLHFPPVWNGFVCQEIVDALHEYGIKTCYFGHIHGAYYAPRTQVYEGIEMVLCAADALNFELAANLRDRLKAVEVLGQKQLVTAGTLADTDVIGFYQNDTKACFAVLHFSGGNLLDKDFEIFCSVDDAAYTVESLLTQYYLSRGYVPKHILLPFGLEDSDLVAQLFEERLNRRPQLRIPQRGDNVRLVELANTNAKEEAERIRKKEKGLPDQ